MAMQMVADLCGTSDKHWAEAAETATDALEARVRLWDGVMEAMG